MDACIHYNVSGAVLFIDLSNAFALLYRHIIFQYQEGDEFWIHRLTEIGFLDGDIQDIFNNINNYPWDNNHSSSSPPFKYLVAQEYYKHTWFTQEFLGKCVFLMIFYIF